NRSRSSWITWVITETFMSSLFWRAKRRGCSAKRTGQKARRTNSRCWKRSRKPPPFRASYRKREKFTLRPSSRRGEESLKRVPQAARHAATEALVGNETQARTTAQEALAMDRSRATAFFAGLALAMADDTRQAAAVVDELSKRFPTDTFVSNIWVPTIRGEIEINRGNPGKAIECSR